MYTIIAPNEDLLELQDALKHVMTNLTLPVNLSSLTP